MCPLDVHGSVLQYVGSSVSAARYRIYTADTSPIALIEDWTGKYLRQVNLLLIAMFYVIVGLKFTKFNFCWGSLPSAVPCCHFATGEREQRKLPAWCANRGGGRMDGINGGVQRETKRGGVYSQIETHAGNQKGFRPSMLVPIITKHCSEHHSSIYQKLKN